MRIILLSGESPRIASESSSSLVLSNALMAHEEVGVVISSDEAVVAFLI